MKTPVRPLSPLALVGVLIWTTAGCHSESATPTSATPASTGAAVPEATLPASTDVPVQEALPVTLDDNVRQTAHTSDPAVAPPPEAPAPEPIPALPVVDTVKKNVNQAVGELDQGVQQTADELKQGVRRKADNVKRDVEQTADQFEHKVHDRTHELTDGLIKKAEDYGKGNVPKGLQRAQDELKKEFGGNQ
jgi:hypothetical protein